jgi:hypothetical protein
MRATPSPGGRRTASPRRRRSARRSGCGSFIRSRSSGSPSAHGALSLVSRARKMSFRSSLWKRYLSVSGFWRSPAGHRTTVIVDAGHWPFRTDVLREMRFPERSNAIRRRPEGDDSILPNREELTIDEPKHFVADACVYASSSASDLIQFERAPIQLRCHVRSDFLVVRLRLGRSCAPSPHDVFLTWSTPSIVARPTN